MSGSLLPFQVRLTAYPSTDAARPVGAAGGSSKLTTTGSELLLILPSPSMTVAVKVLSPRAGVIPTNLKSPDESAEMVVLVVAPEEVTIVISTMEFGAAPLPASVRSDVLSGVYPGFLSNRRVIVVDGTGVSMPDTSQNQAEWPQTSSQRLGCGFPTARICACFLLESGALLSYAIGNKKSHELPLFRQQWKIFNEGDIFLGDKGFCSYFDIANLLKQGVDSVVTLARRTPVNDANCIKILGPDDLLISWKRPVYNTNLSYSLDEWTKLPEELILRQIRVAVNNPGFRTQEFYIVTTLLDAAQYPAKELAEIYFKRWDVELFFRDIKTTMKMDILRCLTPEMIKKEILMHFIAYNCVRRLMYEAAEEVDIEVRVVSFKGSLQALRNWEPHLNQAKVSKVERFRLIRDLYDAMTNTPIRQRPGRSEPRCVKRRPKNNQRMTAPRHEMKEIPHRNRYRAENS